MKKQLTKEEKVLSKIHNKLKKNIFIQIKKDILKIKQTGSCLDIGCGEGLFLSLIKNEYDAKGIEIDKLRIKNKLPNIKIIESKLENYHPNEKYDIITLFEVFEHFINPYEQLQNIKNLLKKDGIIIIEVPNLDAQVLTNNYNIDEHYYFYNEWNLKRILKGSGFKIIKIIKGDYIINDWENPIIKTYKKISNILNLINPTIIAFAKKGDIVG